jgi:D-alanine-D-alanine ligase
MKRKVGIIFGGKSGEHEVSIQSAKNIYEALDRAKYDVILLGVDKAGRWRLGSDASFILNASDPRLIALNSTAPAVVPVEDTGRNALTLKDPETGSVRDRVDVFFPIMHGTYGEDGSLQGFLRLLNAPFVGAGVLGSAVGMDKDVMKRLLRDAGLPVPDFKVVRAGDAGQADLDEIIAALGLPVFVKPCNLGSSVGITKVKRAGDLPSALAEAFKYDSKAIVERAIVGREIECAVLGNEKPEASVCGEIAPKHEFYSYEAKYVDENGAALFIPAELPPETSDTIRSLAVAAFKVLECSGMARVDFFLEENGEALINEINTLPGFTRISMYPKLWEASGLSYTALLDRLIGLAFESHERESALRRSVAPEDMLDKPGSKE